MAAIAGARHKGAALVADERGDGEARGGTGPNWPVGAAPEPAVLSGKAHAMRRFWITAGAGVVLSIVLLPAGLATAEAPAVGQAADQASASTPPEIELTAEEKAEREARKACRIDICRAFHAKPAASGPVACNVVKSWRKEQLDKIVGKMKVSWPYGAVVCKSDIKLEAADLSKAMSGAKHDFALSDHQVSCQVMREEGEPTDIKISFAPSVSFENGKATKAAVNWGKVEAPTMLKGLLWTATAADNTAGLLSGMLVEDINMFTSKKCDEVKDDWAQ
jgi:hypothetical protein